MSKKIVVGFLVLTFVFGGFFTSVEAQNINLTQLIELFISLGIISPDKADQARSIAAPTPITTTSLKVVGSNTEKTKTSFVDLKINGIDTITVSNPSLVKVSWIATSTQSTVRYCIGTGSAFAVQNNGTWGTNGTLSSTGEVNLMISTVSSPSSVFNIGIQCTLSNGSTVTDSVPVTISSTQTTTPSLTVVYPNGGESFTFSQGKISVKYVSSNIVGKKLTVYLYSPVYNNVASYTTYAGNSGTFDFDIVKGSPFTDGTYKINICADDVSNPAVPFKPLCDISNDYFKISGSTATNNSPVSVSYPLTGQTFVAGKTIDVAFTNPVYGERYSVRIRGKAYEYTLGMAYIDNATDQKKSTFLLPSSIPTYYTQYYVVIVNAAGVDVANSGAINITNPEVVPTTVNTTNGISIGSVPSSLAPGASFNVTVKNTGTRTWGNTHDLGISSGSVNLQFANLGTTAQYGSKTVTFTAPTTPGTYTIRAVEQNIGWFGDSKTFTVVIPVVTTPAAQPVVASLSVNATCVTPGTNVTATAYVSGDAITSKVLEKDTNADGVYGTAASWGSGAGTHSFTTSEGASYSGRIDFKLVVNGILKDTKSVTIAQSCGGPITQSCAGSEPTGTGVSKGNGIYTTGYGTTQWTFVTGSPMACQWTCASGYGLSGNSCAVIGSASPTYPTYQSCGGVEPSSSVATKGNGSYQTGYGTTQWTFVTGSPMACQYTCANGATWNGSTCAIPVANQKNGISINAPSSITPNTSITVTVTNTGTKPWGSSHDLGLSTADGSTNLQFINLNGVAAGGSKTVTFSGPTDTGSYIIRAVEQGVEWFGNSSITVTAEGAIVPKGSNVGAALVGFDRIMMLLKALIQ